MSKVLIVTALYMLHVLGKYLRHETSQILNFYALAASCLQMRQENGKPGDSVIEFD